MVYWGLVSWVFCFFYRAFKAFLRHLPVAPSLPHANTNTWRVSNKPRQGKTGLNWLMREETLPQSMVTYVEDSLVGMGSTWSRMSRFGDEHKT